MTVYNRLQKVAAVLVGTTLFVSGSFKLMDPVGTGLIVDEYWKLFHLGFMSPASQVVGLILSLIVSRYVPSQNPFTREDVTVEDDSPEEQDLETE